MARRLAATAIAAVVVALAAGCGESAEQTGASAAADRAAVAARVRTYLNAYVAGRAREACAQYTRALRAQDDRRAHAAGFAGGCPEVLAKVRRGLFAQLSPARRGALLRRLPATRIAVRLAGDRALATLTLGGERVPSARRIELRRLGDDWRISRLAVPVGVRWP